MLAMATRPRVAQSPLLIGAAGLSGICRWLARLSYIRSAQREAMYGSTVSSVTVEAAVGEMDAAANS